jgi:Transposase.
MSAGKVMIIIFWDCEGVIRVGAMLRQETINSDTYIKTPTELRKHFKQVWRFRKPSQNLVRQCYPIHHYSLDLAPSDFHLFGALKDAICGTKFETNDDVIHQVRTWLHEQDNAWYQQGIYKHTCSLLAIKWTDSVDRVQPSLFTMCDFHDLRKNIYWQKKWGITLWATLVHSS